MTDGTERKGATRSSCRRPGREAGFDCTRRELEEIAASNLQGIATDPKLLSGSGLWVTYLGREPCCGARLLLNVRAREQLDDETLEEVLRAAERSRDLRHPSVLSTRRYGSSDDVVWVSTRAYRGRLLRIIPGTEPGAGRSRAVDFIRRVAGPLEAVHRDGLVHGALGEASFHCDTEGRIRIRNLELDVPLVRRFGRTGVESKTVSHTAPEVLDGAPPMAESDQYALAALLVRLLTGRAPEANGSVEWHAVPGPMRRPLRRALRLDPEERFSSVLDMWEALDPEESAGRRASRARGLGEPSPDAEMPGSPTRPARDDGPGDSDAAGGAPHPPGRATPHRPGRGGPASNRPSARRRRPTTMHDTGPPESTSPHPRGTMGSWGRGRRRRRATGPDAGRSGPWSRTFAAAAALVLLFGTVEVVGEWDRLSPFATTPPDTLGPTAQAGGSPDAATALGMPEAPEEEDDVSIPPTTPDEPAASESDAASSGLEDPGTIEGETDPGSMARATETGEPGAGTEEAAVPEPASAPPPTPASRSTSDQEGIAELREPGVLSLHSYPWGEVYLDGDFVGNSPIVELRVSAGSHEIRIERDGYEPYVEMITVEAGEIVRRTGIVLRSGAR